MIWGRIWNKKLPGLPEYHVLLINKEHPMVEGLAKLSKSKIIVKKNQRRRK